MYFLRLDSEYEVEKGRAQHKTHNKEGYATYQTIVSSLVRMMAAAALLDTTNFKPGVE